MWKIQTDEFTLTIRPDELAESPRTSMDNVGHMVCWHKRYRLGDEHSFATPTDLFDYLKEEYGKAWARKVVMLPLYLYDHSGITMSTAPFSCPWDSGQVGWIWADKDELRKDLPKKGRESAAEWQRRAEDYLRGEVHTYDQYLCGEVVRYVLEDSDGAIIDSLCDIYLDKSRSAVEQILTDYLDWGGILTAKQIAALRAAAA